MIRNNRSPSRTLGKTVHGVSRASQLSATRSEYRAPPASFFARPMDGVLPGGVATRRPPPLCPRPPAGSGLLSAVIGTIALPSLMGWRPLCTSDIRYGGYGAVLGASLYSTIKLLNRRRPKLWAMSILGVTGAYAGLSYNTLRLENILEDWTKEIDKNTGNTFYFNHRTGLSQWDSPAA